MAARDEEPGPELDMLVTFLARLARSGSKRYNAERWTGERKRERKGGERERDAKVSRRG